MTISPRGLPHWVGYGLPGSHYKWDSSTCAKKGGKKKKKSCNWSISSHDRAFKLFEPSIWDCLAVWFEYNICLPGNAIMAVLGTDAREFLPTDIKCTSLCEPWFLRFLCFKRIKKEMAILIVKIAEMTWLTTDVKSLITLKEAIWNQSCSVPSEDLSVGGLFNKINKPTAEVSLFPTLDCHIEFLIQAYYYSVLRQVRHALAEEIGTALMNSRSRPTHTAATRATWVQEVIRTKMNRRVTPHIAHEQSNYSNQKAQYIYACR